MWIKSKASQESTWKTNDGRTDIVGHSRGEWYWYIAAQHRVFINMLKNKDLGGPAKEGKWRGTAIKDVASEKIAKKEALEFLKKNR